MKRQITIISTIASVLSLIACGNPGGISDAEYKEYKLYGAPKFLYSCTKVLEPDLNTITFCLKQDKTTYSECTTAHSKKEPGVYKAVGLNSAESYNSLIKHAKDSCLSGEEGRFKILESEQ